jgi:energy-converting hydrogenase Eha subunit E
MKTVTLKIDNSIYEKCLVPKLRLGMPTLKLCLMFNAYKHENELVLFTATPSQSLEIGVPKQEFGNEK